ncbi:MAG: hypothetical protein LUF02_02155, partial [Erysipelotrichaceae bacterium]|nr:hypothetical protein [Erysipelotrichaceae bacterium]
MKKLLILFLLLCLCGCQQESKQVETQKLILLLDDILQVMPMDVYDHLDVLVCVDHTYRFKDDEENPTLCLDFTYDENDQLIQYVFKEYGFVDEELVGAPISEKEAKLLAQDFAKTFLDKEDVLYKCNDYSCYDTGDYMTFKDKRGGISMSLSLFLRNYMLMTLR